MLSLSAIFFVVFVAGAVFGCITMKVIEHRRYNYTYMTVSVKGESTSVEKVQLCHEECGGKISIGDKGLKCDKCGQFADFIRSKADFLQTFIQTLNDGNERVIDRYISRPNTLTDEMVRYGTKVLVKKAKKESFHIESSVNKAESMLLTAI